MCGREKDNQDGWAMCVCVERIDVSLSWGVIEEIVSTALLWEKKVSIVPFAENRGLFIGDSWAEACWLNSHGS